MQLPHRSRGVARLLLWLLLGLVCYLAWRPNPGDAVSSGSDKLDHLAAFATLTVVALSAYGSAWRWHLIATALLGYGGLIELVQILVPGRSAEALDVLADGLGIAAGLLIGRFLLAGLRTKSSAEPR